MTDVNVDDFHGTYCISLIVVSVTMNCHALITMHQKTQLFVAACIYKTRVTPNNLSTQGFVLCLKFLLLRIVSRFTTMIKLFCVFHIILLCNSLLLIDFINLKGSVSFKEGVGKRISSVFSTIFGYQLVNVIFMNDKDVFLAMCRFDEKCHYLL